MVKRASDKSGATKQPVPRRKGRPLLSGDEGVGPAAILEAACELVKELPPERITRAEVARRANVDPGLIRYYFQDRSSLLRATAKTLSDRFQRRAADATIPKATPEETLRTRIKVFLEFELTYPFFHRLITEELVVSDADVAQSLLNEVSHRGVAGYSRILEAGVATGRMRMVDPALLYLSIIGFVELASKAQPILAELAHPLASAEDYADQFSHFITDLLMNGLRSAPALAPE